MDSCAFGVHAALGNRVSTTAGHVFVNTYGILLTPAGPAQHVVRHGSKPSACVAMNGPGMTPGMCGMRTLDKGERGIVGEERNPRWKK